MADVTKRWDPTYDITDVYTHAESAVHAALASPNGNIATWSEAGDIIVRDLFTMLAHLERPLWLRAESSCLLHLLHLCLHVLNMEE